MQYDGLAWFTGLLALVALCVALRILYGRSWFLGWLRGTCGLAVVGLAALFGLVGYDLRGYTALPEGQPLATLSFTAEGAQRYRVNLTENGVERVLTLEGDLWQLDARLLRLKGLADLIGLQPGYRLDKLSGRFLAIEQQETARNVQVQLGESLYGVDLWRWLRVSRHDLFMFDPQAARVTYLPMANGAMFNVVLTPTGLLAQPMNQAASQALKDWQ